MKAKEKNAWGNFVARKQAAKAFHIVDMAALPSMLWNTTGAWGMEGPDDLILCILSVRQPTSLHFQIVGVESEKNLGAKGLKLLNILLAGWMSNPPARGPYYPRTDYPQVQRVQESLFLTKKLNVGHKLTPTATSSTVSW